LEAGSSEHLVLFVSFGFVLFFVFLFWPSALRNRGNHHHTLSAQGVAGQ
jgi:hypothetical protein